MTPGRRGLRVQRGGSPSRPVATRCDPPGDTAILSKAENSLQYREREREIRYDKETQVKETLKITDTIMILNRQPVKL